MPRRSTSSADASSRCARDLARLLADLLRRAAWTGDAADARGSDCRRCRARTGDSTVSPCRPRSWSYGTPSVVRSDLRPRSLVALAVRGRAGEDRRRAGRVQRASDGSTSQPGPTPSAGSPAEGASPADLDPRREPDTAVVAARGGLAPAVLEAVVVGERERLVERGLVVARVVGEAGGRGVRERSGGMKFFRRISAGSMPSSSASRSMMRSIEMRGLGSPAPR